MFVMVELVVLTDLMRKQGVGRTPAIVHIRLVNQAGDVMMANVSISMRSVTAFQIAKMVLMKKLDVTLWI